MSRLSTRQTISYSFGSFAAGLFYFFNNFTLPLYLKIFTNNDIIIAWLSNTRSIEQAFIQPFIGAWSDRTWTRFGRRAPFFMVAMPLSALLFFSAGLIPLDRSFVLAAIVLIFLFSLLFNFGIDPYVALLADVTPSEHRGTVNGIAAVFGFGGQIALALAAFALWSVHPFWVFALVGAGLIVGFGIVALGVREPRELAHPKGAQAARDPQDHLLKPSLSPYIQYVRDRWSEEREAMKLLGVAFLFQFGLNAARPFLTLFIVNEIGTRGWPELVNAVPGLAGIGLGGADASSLSQLLAGFFLIMTAVWVLPCGNFGDRFGKKRVFALGLIVVGAVAFLAAFATTVPQLLFYLLFLGFGNAAVTILFFPYLSDLVAPNRIGEFQGLSAAAETLGVFGGGIVAGFLIDWNPYGLHYRLSFITTAIFLVLAVVAVVFVRARLEASPGKRPASLTAE